MNKKNFKTLIIMCWVLLAVCVVIKLFGGNWFELSTDNTKFIDFCAFVDNTMWLKMILACIINLATNYFILCIMINKVKLPKLYLLISFPLLILKSIISWYNVVIPFILEIFNLILIPLIYCKFKNWKKVIITNVVIVVFQFISTFIRNTDLNITYNNYFIIQSLIQIDYIIMILLFYFYNFKYLKKGE